MSAVDLLHYALTASGAVVMAFAVAGFAVRAWAWLRLRVLHRSPIKGFVVDLTRGADRMRAAGWQLNLRGFVIGRVGFGIVIGTPPMRTCEHCDRQFPGKAAVVAHERQAHSEAHP